MKITNKWNLPLPLVDAVTFDSYRPSTDRDYTVSEVNSPPRIRILRKVYDAEIEEDVTDRIWALFGSAVHEILYKSAYKRMKAWMRSIIGKATLTPPPYRVFEHRLLRSIKVGDREYVIAGKPDLIDSDGQLEDWKCTTSWKPAMGDYGDWEKELNLHAWLAEGEGVKVKSIAAVMILRDWQEMKAVREDDYPQQRVIRQKLPLWSEAIVETYLKNRIELHATADVLRDAYEASDPKDPILLEALPECSSAERWETAPTFAVMKKDGKRAKKVFKPANMTPEAVAAEHADAESYAVQANSAVGKQIFSVEVRPGESKRCSKFCDVAKYCSQYREIQKTVEAANEAAAG